MTNKNQFEGIQYVKVVDLGLSQIYLSADKITRVRRWFRSDDLSVFEPLPVHDFGNGRLTLTDGHSRAFVAYKTGVTHVPVVYDADDMIISELGQHLCRHDIVWCDRFELRDVRDLESRILSSGDYQRLWLDRCEKAYNLLSQTNEARRELLVKLCPALFLYGASQDLSILYFEDEQEQTYTISNN